VRTPALAPNGRARRNDACFDPVAEAVAGVEPHIPFERVALLPRHGETRIDSSAAQLLQLANGIEQQGGMRVLATTRSLVSVADQNSRAIPSSMPRSSS
jgi:hypothetical protein